MRLSYSSISAYKNCPLSYKYAYIDKLPRKKSVALSFGSSIHQALYFFYSNPAMRPPTVEAVLDNLWKNWVSDGYESSSEEDSYRELAERTVRTFYQTNIQNFIAPLALEYKFQIDLGAEEALGEKCLLTGVIDRVQKNDKGEIEVIDYKTSKRLPPTAQINSDLQLTIYYYAAKEIWGMEPKKLSLYFVLPGIEMATFRQEEDIPVLKKEIIKTASDILKMRFEPNENPLCPWCDFQKFCPLFKDKFSEDENEVKIEDKVEEYVALKGELGQKKERLESLRDEIYTYLEVNGLKRAFSPLHAITLNEFYDYDYDLVAIKEILEPLGLFEEVIEIRRSLLSALMTSGRLTEDQVGLIEKHRKEKGVIKRLSSKKLGD